MITKWIPLKQAVLFVKDHHRHLPKIQGGIIALGLFDESVLRGVAILGRGARLDKPDTVTITRVCTDGVRNGCSMLIAKIRRVAQALGFVKVKTFTMEGEQGKSLVAAGAVKGGETDGRNMDRKCRSRKNGLAGKRTRWIL